jgi:hypothetical protein
MSGKFKFAERRGAGLPPEEKMSKEEAAEIRDFWSRNNVDISDLMVWYRRSRADVEAALGPEALAALAGGRPLYRVLDSFCECPLHAFDGTPEAAEWADHYERRCCSCHASTLSPAKAEAVEGVMRWLAAPEEE